MGDAGPVIAMMGTAIAAMWMFVVWLYRSTLARADQRIQRLEEREEQTLAALAEAIKPVPGMMQTMVEAFRELRIALSYQRPPDNTGSSGRP